MQIERESVELITKCFSHYNEVKSLKGLIFKVVWCKLSQSNEAFNYSEHQVACVIAIFRYPGPLKFVKRFSNGWVKEVDNV